MYKSNITKINISRLTLDPDERPGAALSQWVGGLTHVFTSVMKSTAFDGECGDILVKGDLDTVAVEHLLVVGSVPLNLRSRVRGHLALKSVSSMGSVLSSIYDKTYKYYIKNY